LLLLGQLQFFGKFSHLQFRHRLLSQRDGRSTQEDDGEGQALAEPFISFHFLNSISGFERRHFSPCRSSWRHVLKPNEVLRQAISERGVWGRKEIEGASLFAFTHNPMFRTSTKCRK
jgi:hypothetical protein